MTPRQKRALAALLNSPTQAAAASAAGVGASTLRDWLKNDEEFKREYERATTELLAEASVQAKQSLSPALSTLREITVDRGSPGAVRVQAARSILEYGLKLTEREDIIARLDKLEKMIKDQ